MKVMHVSKRGFLVALVLAGVALGTGAGCGGDDAGNQVNGSIEGAVYVTGPVAGAVVTAYPLDLSTGELGDPIASSPPTDAAGAFHLDLGLYFGPVMLTAKGVGASYKEPASGVQVAWDSTTELRAVYIARTPEQSLTLDFKRGTQVTSVQVTPFSELAIAYSFARKATQKSPTLEQAFQHAHERFRDYLKVDFWSVPPADLTRPAGGWNDSVQFGAELAGLSSLVLKIANESQISPAGLTSLQLLGLLRRDIADVTAQFDGYEVATAASTPLSLGTCEGVCRFSSCTMSGNYAEAIASFLGSSVNLSGIGVTDAQALLQQLASPSAAGAMELFPSDAQCSLDSEGPTITVEGIVDADILSGQVIATVTFSDAVAIDQTSVTFTRNDVAISTDFFTSQESSPSVQTKVVTLTLNTAQLNDGPVEMVMTAQDQAGNPPTTLVYSLFFDNSPLGHVSGTVVVGGRVQGARVSVFEYDGEVRGAKLGEATTDDEGRYFVEVAETTQGVLLVEVDEASATSASYIEAVNGAIVEFGPTDRLHAIVTGWVDGQERTDGMVTPWTEIAVQFAHGLYVTTYNEVPAQLPMAVSDAYAYLEEHFNDGGAAIDLRAVQPADLTLSVGVSTLNSQVRYGMIVTALGKVAETQATESGGSSATMNTLTLTTKLAQDLGGTFTGSESVPPLLDGRTGAGILSHGSVQLTSHVTRLDLAIGLANFLMSGENATTFGQLDVAVLLDTISQDSRPVLYPMDEPGGPFDIVPPAPVAFTAPTPTELKVLRGQISLRLEASDNHSLDVVEWLSPAGITGVTTDISAGPTGPWVLLGSLNTDGFAEGNLAIQARATDQAGLATTVTRTVVVDRTNPAVVITGATTAGGPLAEGAVTGAAMLTLSGTATDAHFNAASYSVNGGSAVPIVVGAGGNWSVSVPLANGVNAIVVTANDLAGNIGSDSASYSRDAQPPTVGVVQGVVCDQVLTTTSLSPAAGVASTVTYGVCQSRSILSGDSFSRFASTSAPGANGLPEWQFQVADNHTLIAGVLFEGRLSRAGTVLVDWQPVPTAAVGSGFTHLRALHSGYHAELALVSGTYVLEYRATDEFGNTSAVASVSWTQTLRAPPVRERVATADCGTSDSACPAFYNLNNSLDNTHVALVGGAGLPDGKLWIGSGFVDNPNDVPVRVKLTGAATATYKSGSFHDQPEVAQNVSGNPDNCSVDPILTASHDLATGACVNFPTLEAIDDHTTAFSIFSDVQTIIAVGAGSGTVLAACSGCSATEREIPPHTSIQIYVRSNPFTFLWSFGTPAAVGFGSSLNKTGRILADWKKCLTVFTPADFPNSPRTCTNWQRNRPVQYLLRAKVTPTVTMGLQSKPANAGASYAAPVGDNGAGGAIPASFAFRNFIWNTAENGVTPF